MNLVDIYVPILGASTIQSVGAVIGALTVVGFVIYVAFNIAAGRRQAGSEIQLAPNRRPYLSDEQLETTKLNWTLGAGLVLLLIIAVGLPMYWLAEPGRQSGAEEGFDETFIGRGQELFDEGSDCAACHGPGGTGGQASFTMMADDGDTYIATVQWRAPALDTASLRFSEEELAEVIEYGRPGTPMVGWGEGGQGPLIEQQIDNLVDYIFSLQADLPEEDSGEAPYEAVQADAEEQLAEDVGVTTPDDIDYTDPATGEALFNMSEIGGGAYACARCHTQGWSIDTDTVDDPREPIGDEWPDYVDSEPGSGAFGWNLKDEVPSQFGTVDQLAEFIDSGSTNGEGYGRRGMGSGRMPGFGSDPNTEVDHDGMFTQDMVCSVALYVAGLSEDEAGEEVVEEDATAGTEVAGQEAGDEGGEEAVGEEPVEPEEAEAEAPGEEAPEEAEAGDEVEVVEDDAEPQEMFEPGGFCFGILHDLEPEEPEDGEDADDEDSEDDEVSEQ